MKQWSFWIRLVLVGIVIGGLVVPLANWTFGLGPTTGNVEFAARLEAVWLLYERAVPFSVGPLVFMVTPFQLVYMVVSLFMLFVGFLVCLTRCLCSRHAWHLRWPQNLAGKSKIASLFR